MAHDEKTISPMEPDARPDSEFVAEARRGNTEAFEVLVRRHQPRLFATAYHMVNRREDAEDVVQTAFVKAYRSLPSFRGNSSFYTWLYRITVNVALNHLKRRRRREADSLDDPDRGLERDPAYLELASSDDPGRDAHRTELREKLNAALAQLSEKHRTVVVLHDIEGLPHEEIARMTGASIGTVRSRLFYARQMLQGLLSEYVR